jgi:hypothetical protein
MNETLKAKGFHETTKPNTAKNYKTKKQIPWLESAGVNYTNQATTACRRN